MRSTILQEAIRIVESEARNTQQGLTAKEVYSRLHNPTYSTYPYKPGTANSLTVSSILSKAYYDGKIDRRKKGNYRNAPFLYYPKGYLDQRHNEQQNAVQSSISLPELPPKRTIHLTWPRLLHIHRYRLKMMPGANSYYQCRCKGIKVVVNRGAYTPIDWDWIKSHGDKDGQLRVVIKGYL